jgi:seryl-tRNA synthetase
MEKLNEENYFSLENNMKYGGSSQIKSFISCEKAALAELTGEWIREKSESLLVSSYLDEKISGTLDKFKDENQEIFTKQGELKSQYKHIEEIYNEINSERNEMFKKYLNGKHQVIMTGSISNIPVKIKIDSYHENKCIVDLKCVKNFDLIYNEKTKKREDFITYYDYILQRKFISRGC